MIDQRQLLIIALVRIKPLLRHLIGDRWHEFLNTMDRLADDMERGDELAYRGILDLFSAYPAAYRTLIRAVDESDFELLQFRKATSVPIVSVRTRSFVVLPVFFATNRAFISNITPPYYTSSRDRIQFGRVDVSIPINHRLGQLERPKWWKLEFTDDPTKHVMILNVSRQEPDLFLDHLHRAVELSSGRDVLIFVHGFNVTFEDAARRTAQIAADLRFPGPIILFSWPSEGKLHKYIVDETNARWAIEDLERFLRMLLIDTTVSSLYVISHSMGGRIFAEAVHRLCLSPAPKNEARLKHIIFAAPDIDTDTFKASARHFSTSAAGCTLYASSNDEALAISKCIHGYSRAGDAGANIIVMEGVVTIDASAVDTSLLGHSYFSSRRSVLSDIHDLIRYGHGPADRFGLIMRTHPLGSYWVLQG